ncbi:MAG: hypothetical protein WCS65_09605 [Verrucomicrobiae bacterium]
MSLTIEPLAEAKARMDGKVAVGNDLMNFQWAEDVPLAMRERAFWSARLQSAHLTQGMLDMVRKGTSLETQPVERGGKPVDLTMSKSLFVRESRKMLDAAGFRPADPAWEGTLLDHRSKQRLELIYETNIRQASEYANFLSGQDEGALDAFPAQELIREESRINERPWHQIWRDHGGQSFGGRMVALKSDGIWSRISRFETPYPPFDFGSGMGVEDVARDEAEDFGLIAPGEVPTRADVGFNDSLQASVQGLDPKVVGSLMRSFNGNGGDPIVEMSADTIKWIKDVPPLAPAPEKISIEAAKAALLEGYEIADKEGESVRFGPTALDYILAGGGKVDRLAFLRWAEQAVQTGNKRVIGPRVVYSQAFVNRHGKRKGMVTLVTNRNGEVFNFFPKSADKLEGSTKRGGSSPSATEKVEPLPAPNPHRSQDNTTTPEVKP